MVREHDEYASIIAYEPVGRLIGELYMGTPEVITPEVERAYAAFAEQVEIQFAELTRSVRVEFQDEDPYPDAWAMISDVEYRRRLKIYRTTEDQRHPILTLEQNNMFRAVHDYHGHYMADRDFSRHGEEAAWWRHRQMFTGRAARVMTTELRGQTSAFIWINGGVEFPPQKAILLPEWVSEAPPVGARI